MAKYNSAGEPLAATGGMIATSVIAGAAAAAIPSAKAYHGVLVTTAGTAQLNIHHGSSTAGPIVGCIAANAAAGTPQMIGVDCPNGVFVNSGTNSPAVTVFTS